MLGIAALALGYVLSQFFRSFMAVLTPALMAEVDASKVDLSIASGAWFAAFALAQFPIGTFFDRYGPRRTVAAILALGGGGGALVFAAATQPWMITLAMALLGLGCAPVLMAAIFVFARSYAPARLAVLSSWFIAIGSAGNVAGTTPLAAAAELFGWRGSLVGVAVLSLLTALALLVLLRDPPPVVAPTAANGAPGDEGWTGFLQVARIRPLWPIVPLIGMNYAPMIGILGLWAGPFLADVHGADSLAIGRVTLVMSLGVIAGSFLYGPLDTLFRTRKWVAVAGNSGSVAVLLWLALAPPAALGGVIAAFALLGIFGTSFGLIMAHARAFLPEHLTGRGMTLLNFFSIGIVGGMQFASGAVVKAATLPDRPEAAYAALFLFYALALALSVGCYLFSRDVPPETQAAPAPQPAPARGR